jgi:hypothetical protein
MQVIKCDVCGCSADVGHAQIGSPRPSGWAHLHRTVEMPDDQAAVAHAHLPPVARAAALQYGAYQVLDVCPACVEAMLEVARAKRSVPQGVAS